MVDTQMQQVGACKGSSASRTLERSSEVLAEVRFCRSLRDAVTGSEPPGMVTAHLEWSICFCTPCIKQFRQRAHTSFKYVRLPTTQ